MAERDNAAVRDSIDQLREMPLLTRCVVVGGSVLGVCGALAGLVVGLSVHPATALFAAIELGFPAAAAGLLVGLLIGASILIVRHVLGRAHRSQPLE